MTDTPERSPRDIVGTVCEVREVSSAEDDRGVVHVALQLTCGCGDSLCTGEDQWFLFDVVTAMLISQALHQAAFDVDRPAAIEACRLIAEKRGLNFDHLNAVAKLFMESNPHAN